ncbi:MAG TPA: DUF3618 domain-containing protein [Thermoanaerobaculia bacterium]|nr:DUF3618 domain-containing protein [Thermoanaerobaculia bacterium]
MSGGGTGEPQPQDTRTPAEIHHEIQRSRADLDDTIDALGRRLRPKRLLWEARHKIEPEVRHAGHLAADGARDNKSKLAIAAGAVAGVWLLRKLARRRRAKKRAFPPEQRGV